MDALNGSEVQLGTFQVTVHDDTPIEEAKEKVRAGILRTFDGETAHKVIRISYQRGAKVVATNAGYEELLYKDIDQYVDSVLSREYFPLVFMFQCFVTFTPPKAVE